MSNNEELACPFCHSQVNVPPQEGLVLSCGENGGSCPQTGYIKTMIESGDNMPEQTALMILYEELSGLEWKDLVEGKPQAPDCEYIRRGFILPDGTVTRDIPEEFGTIWGVDFMRLKERETITDKIPV